MIAKGSPVTALKGIGPRSAEELRSLGILTAEDLLRFFPAGYDRPEAVTEIAAAPADVPTAVRGILTTAPVNRGFGNKTVTSFSIADGSGRLGVAFFHMPYLKNSLHKGDERVFRGVISETKYGLRMDHPKIFQPEEYDRLTHAIWPVYPTMGILSQKNVPLSPSFSSLSCLHSHEYFLFFLLFLISLPPGLLYPSHPPFLPIIYSFNYNV